MTQATTAGIGNVEGLVDYDVRWSWAERARPEPGFTAVVRVKNEARSLPYVLPPLLRAVAQVVVVDNDSTDGTPDVALRTAEENESADRLRVVSYPFSVSRCGPEHLATPADSVHSLTYFYNWSFAHVRTAYTLKWDGDMVLTDVGVAALRDLAWQLEPVQRIVTMLRYPLYVVDASTAFLDVSVYNRETWGWPNDEGFVHSKAFEWELPRWPREMTSVSLPDWACIELKHLDVDEFAHWSHEDFDATVRTSRKRREWDVFHALNGGGEAPYGLVRVDAPDGRDVIDYVRSEWLLNEKVELIKLHRRTQLGLALRR